MSLVGSLLQKVTSPSSRYALGTLVLGGLIVGAAGVVGFDASMEATSTNDFCLSCHELAENAGREFEGTSHHTNSTGKQATCSDCHMPKEFVPGMLRKIQALIHSGPKATWWVDICLLNLSIWTSHAPAAGLA